MDEILRSNAMTENAGLSGEEPSLSVPDRLVNIIIENHKSIAAILKGIFSRIEPTGCSNDLVILGKFTSLYHKQEFFAALERAVETFSNECETLKETSAALRLLSVSFEKMEEAHQHKDMHFLDALVSTSQPSLNETDQGLAGVSVSSRVFSMFPLFPAIGPPTIHEYENEGSAVAADFHGAEKYEYTNLPEILKLKDERRMCLLCKKIFESSRRLLRHAAFCRRDLASATNGSKRCHICHVICDGQSGLMKPYAESHPKKL